jgi:hypothetical protein
MLFGAFLATTACFTILRSYRFYRTRGKCAANMSGSDNVSAEEHAIGAAFRERLAHSVACTLVPDWRPELLIQHLRDSSTSRANSRTALNDYLLRHVLHVTPSELLKKYNSSNAADAGILTARQLRAREHQVLSLLLLEVAATSTPLQVCRCRW